MNLSIFKTFLCYYSLCILGYVLQIQAKVTPLQSFVSIEQKGPTCDRNVLSCHWNGSKVDGCCSPQYGLVVFTLQWVPGYGPSDEFTIHGIWPDTCNGGRAPRKGCDATRRTNNIGPIIKSINPSLYQNISRLWPSYKGDNNWFWSHEWNTHGSCVTTLRPNCYGEKYTKYQDVNDYFQKAIDLQQDYDIYGVLNVAGVFPGRTYNLENMHSVLQKEFGHPVKIDCNRSGQLKEISLFFYVQGRDDYILTDAITRGNCRHTVYYPKKY
ncbi:ribonuclease T2-like protein [Halteromyces radiatus]|uniref:ribonuclease T2-like protein n=1 Tax=Halteromyces radiatus TaxID=101107 RepID=UPI0022200E4A|nr:ribonuclease T2-like protein [Halteromyces radiatus]KAI8081682.1 ribonuclease T2-like protein [Halteromyces radiatus]